MIAARGFRRIVFFFDLLQSILGISTDLAYCTYIGEEGNSIGGVLRTSGIPQDGGTLYQTDLGVVGITA